MLDKLRQRISYDAPVTQSKRAAISYAVPRADFLNSVKFVHHTITVLVRLWAFVLPPVARRRVRRPLRGPASHAIPHDPWRVSCAPGDAPLVLLWRSFAEVWVSVLRSMSPAQLLPATLVASVIDPPMTAGVERTSRIGNDSRIANDSLNGPYVNQRTPHWSIDDELRPRVWRVHRLTIRSNGFIRTPATSPRGSHDQQRSWTRHARPLQIRIQLPDDDPRPSNHSCS
jgi:hypothetical protein